MTAPLRPSSPGTSADHAKLLTKAGTASGATKAIRQKERPGSEVRSTSHAAATPSTVEATPVRATSATVLPSSSPTRGRQTSAHASPAPDSNALTTTMTSGNAHSSATTSAAGRSGSGARADDPPGTLDAPDPLDAPRPRRPRVGDFGAVSVNGSIFGAWSESSGGSAGSEATPVPTAYSLASVVPRTCWPSLLVTNARNFWASAACLLLLRTPPPERLTKAPGSSFLK